MGEKEFSELYDETVRLMKASGKTIKTLARETGIPKDWLVSFRLKRFGSPGIVRVEKLYKHFTGKSILHRRG